MNYSRLMVLASNCIDLLRNNGLSDEEIIRGCGMTEKDFTTIEECDLDNVMGDVYDYESVSDMLDSYNKDNHTEITMSQELYREVVEEYRHNDSMLDATYDNVYECLCTVIEGE